MTELEFRKLCITTVKVYFNSKVEITDNKHLSDDDIYVVWMCKTLQNNKALLSTNILDGMYYELTYNGDKNQLYMDVYKKWENVCINVGGHDE